MGYQFKVKARRAPILEPHGSTLSPGSCQPTQEPYQRRPLEALEALEPLTDLCEVIGGVDYVDFESSLEKESRCAAKCRSCWRRADSAHR
jgi:hypothetical protein